MSSSTVEKKRQSALNTEGEIQGPHISGGLRQGKPEELHPLKLKMQ